MLEYAFAVVACKIDRLDVDADEVGDRCRVDQVLARCAVFVGIVVLPVLHEYADDLVAGALEQPRGDRRVHAAGEAEHDAKLAHVHRSEVAADTVKGRASSPAHDTRPRRRAWGG